MFKKPVVLQRIEGIISSLNLDDFKDDELWTHCEAAFICGVSSQTFRLWMKSLDIDIIKIGQTNFISGKIMRHIIIKYKNRIRLLNVNLDDIKISEQGRRFS